MSIHSSIQPSILPRTCFDFIDFAGLVRQGEKERLTSKLIHVFRPNKIRIYSPWESMMIVSIALNDVTATVGGEFSAGAFFGRDIPIELPTGSAGSTLSFEIRNIHPSNPVGFMCRISGVRIADEERSTMLSEKIVELLKSKKGQHVYVVWSRPAKTKASCPFAITKRTKALVRSGIDYANLSQVKEAIANNERGEVEPLPWGSWKKFPFVISHNGLEYLRLYPASFNNVRSSVEWTKDGMPCKKEEIEEWLYASEKRDFDNEDCEKVCFTVKVNSIIEVDGEKVYVVYKST
jgi:hypothetical protein